MNRMGAADSTSTERTVTGGWTTADEPGHATAEELAAYCDGTLAAEEHQRWEDHMVECRDCAASLVDLLAFRGEGYPDEQPLSEFERAASWKRLQQQIQPPSPLWLRLAASFAAVAAVGLLGWNLVLQSTVRELGRPNLASGFQEVQLGTDTRGEAGSTAIRQPGAGGFTLTLVVPDGDRFTDYQIEIESRSTGHRWSLAGRPQLGARTFIVDLPRKTFPDGDYRLRVSGRRDGATTLIGEKDLTIR